MKIIVNVTREELEEMQISRVDLLRNVLEDLDNAREYPMFGVEVIITEEE